MTLRFTLAASPPVRLALFDVLGREVAVLVGGVRAAGHHSARLDVSGLPSGIYVVRLEADGASQTMPVTVLD